MLRGEQRESNSPVNQDLTEMKPMKIIKRKSVGPHFSMCVQPAFIIGTNNEDGTDNFAPITWVSVTGEPVKKTL